MENILDIIEDRILYVMIKRIEEMIEYYKNYDPYHIGKNEIEEFIVCECMNMFLFDLEELKKLAEKKK